MDFLNAMSAVWQWYAGLEGWLAVVVTVVAGLSAWFVIGLPFGVRASALSRDKFQEGDGFFTRLTAYVGVAVVASFLGALGTGYLVIRWFARLVGRRREKKRTD